ncbi:pyruvate ferredoxin oxidoreductase [candidate division KSB1 bacterium]
MADLRVMEGNHAGSIAVKLARVNVITAYPITPQTQIVELLAEMCASGELDARYIKVESEHSAMAGCLGAAATGARTFTATSSQGLVFMHEMLHWVAGARLPVVMINVNRALSSPWSIWCDHSDSMAQRTTGWMQFYCETAQEVLDTVLQAYRVAETVRMPAMVNLDAFFLSHVSEPVTIPDQKKVDRYLPRRDYNFNLQIGQNFSFGSVTDGRFFAEFRRKMDTSMRKARTEIAEADRIFHESFGRKYDIFETYRMTGAEVALMAAGTAVGTMREAVDDLRGDGFPVGLVKVRVLRPFHGSLLRKVMAGVEKIIVLDRDIDFGQGGIIAQEVRNALYTMKNRPKVYSYICGLGGRDITPEIVTEITQSVWNKQRVPADTVWFDSQG